MCGDYNEEFYVDWWIPLVHTFDVLVILIHCVKLAWTLFMHVLNFLSFVYIVLYDGVCGDMKIFGITLEDCIGSRVVVV